jgi:tetratricopeptide (TPR) repeat protein
MIKIILLNALAILVANYVIKHPGLYSLLITIGGLILVNIVNLFLNRIKFKINRTSLIISAVLLIVISILAINITDASVANSLKRLTDINLRTQSASERFTFYYDALRIFKDNWLIGIGAGGWEAVYKTVQGHLYDSTEVHSSIFQSLIEVGLVGTLLFLALVAIIVTMVFIRVIQKQLDDLDKVIFLAVIVIFAHSIIDFDLSLPAISMYLFVLLGVLKVDQYYAIGSKIWSKVLFGAITLVVAGIFILSAGIGVGHSLTGDAKNAFKEGKSLTVRQVDKYEKNIQRAISLDPLNADYYTLLGQIKVNKASSLHNDVEAEEGINYLNKAIDLEPYNYRRYLVKANNLIQLNRRAEAIASFEKIIQIMPFQHTGYEYAARNYTTLGIETGQKAYLEKTIDTYQRAAEQMTKIDPNRLRLWHYEHLDQSSALNYHTGVAYFLLGEIEKGLNHLKAALKTASSESFKSDILAWMYVGQEKLNLTPRVNVDSSKVKEVEKVIDDFNIKVTGR